MTDELEPDYARTATHNLFDLFLGLSEGETVHVETDDGRTYEGELLTAEVVLGRERFGEDKPNALRATFETDVGGVLRLSQFEDGVSLRSRYDEPAVEGYSFRDLTDSPAVETVEVEDEQDEDDLGSPTAYERDEFADEQDRRTCGECGGEAVHVDTRTVNGWINEASAYPVHNYECAECGSRGSWNAEDGERLGCLAPPTLDAQ